MYRSLWQRQASSRCPSLPALQLRYISHGQAAARSSRRRQLRLDQAAAAHMLRESRLPEGWLGGHAAVAANAWSNAQAFVTLDLEVGVRELRRCRGLSMELSRRAAMAVRAREVGLLRVIKVCLLYPLPQDTRHSSQDAARAKQEEAACANDAPMRRALALVPFRVVITSRNGWLQAFLYPRSLMLQHFKRVRGGALPPPVECRDGAHVTPARAEALAGMGNAKKWKRSFLSEVSDKGLGPRRFVCPVVSLFPPVKHVDLDVRDCRAARAWSSCGTRGPTSRPRRRTRSAPRGARPPRCEGQRSMLAHGHNGGWQCVGVL